MVFPCCSCKGDPIIQKRSTEFNNLSDLRLRRSHPPKLLREETTVAVTLNVYSLTDKNVHFWRFGLGIFHCGVVIYGIEWSYGEVSDNPNASGLFCVHPGMAAGALHKTFTLGRTQKSPMQVDTILHRLENEWRSCDYHILHHNCNHFAQRLCDLLSTSEKLKIPAWCNRIARITDKVVPRKLAKRIQRMFSEDTLQVPKSVQRGCISEIPVSVIPKGWYLHPSIKQPPRYAFQAPPAIPRDDFEVFHAHDQSFFTPFSPQQTACRALPRITSEKKNGARQAEKMIKIKEVVIRMESFCSVSRLDPCEETTVRDSLMLTVPAPAISRLFLENADLNDEKDNKEKDDIGLPKVLELKPSEEGLSRESRTPSLYQEKGSPLEMDGRSKVSSLDPPIISEKVSTQLWGSISNFKEDSSSRKVLCRAFSAPPSTMRGIKDEEGEILMRKNKERSPQRLIRSFSL
ncbi:unnamed protein product [Phytomonas sp. Hart1]|nr:unnamed protein product [Phytomonas sp. Hart1]|eukprot:CCW66067.1 unnamed protein product [Phytomonas sp. isolate Hart1]